MDDDPPSTPLTGKMRAAYKRIFTAGGRVEKATKNAANQAEEEPDAEMVMKSPKVARHEQKQYFQESLQLKHPLAEGSEGEDELRLKLYQLEKTLLQERQPTLEPGRKVPDSQTSSSGMLDWKEGHLYPFDICPRENLTIHHHRARGRWDNKGSFSTKIDTGLHNNMFPAAKDFTLEESQDAWIQWVNDAFPNLHGTHFWLPVCAKDFASVHCTEEQSKLDTSQQHAPWYNLVKNDSALQRVLLCLKEISEAQDEVMFVLSQLYVGQNPGEPCYSAAADYLPPSDSVPPAPLRNWEEGDFDLLIIHRTYGLVVCEVKAFDDNSSKSDMSQHDVDSKIRSKLIEAILQVDRAEAVLSHLVSDIVPGLRITKTIAFPNLTGRQVQQALAEDPILIEDLCLCLGATDVAGITDLCLTSDQLSVSGTPGTVSTDFGNWWLRCVVGSGSATEISFADYQRLLARFCGPAVTVTVPCLSPPRLSLKTLDQPSSFTSLCRAVITLFPEQVHLLNTATPRVLLTGPPGTGKSLVLQLKATEWLRCGCDVIMVRPRRRGGAACLITYYLLKKTLETQLAKTVKSGHLYLLEYDFNDDGDIEEAVTDLLRAAKGRPLYVIVDAIDSPSLRYQWRNIKRFLRKLSATVTDLHCWAADYDLEFAPSNCQVQHLTRPIRFPKFVEMESADFHPDIFKPYSQRGQHDTTPGPPVQWFLLPKHDHRRLTGDCVTCGELVVRFLQGLLAGASENTSTSLTSITSTIRDTTSTRLRYRDVLIVKGRYDHINLKKALKNAGIPVQNMKHYITEDMITSNRNEVWMVSTDDLQGLERKVVVIVGETEPDKYVGVFHCTSQLVFISQTEYYGNCDIASEDEQKLAEEIQKEERDTDKTGAKCHITESEDVKILTSSTLDTDPQSFSVLYPIRLDLGEASLPPTEKPNRSHDECRAGEATERSDDMASSPIFSKPWQDCSYFSAEGGRLQVQGSDVVLQVPAGVIDDNTKVAVHVAICANDVYIKHKLQLPVTETIVSPLAEFKADHDFCFQNHIQITLPTCLSSDYDVNLLHVYCITHGGQEEEINISEIQRLEDMTQTPDKEALAAYFYVNEERQVEVMTSHFSGYVCTYCGLCQNIGLQVYASPTYDNESVQVSVIARLWDKIHISDFRQWKPEDNCYKEVLSTTFQLKKMLIPAELQVDLIIDNDQTTTWQFNQKLAATNTFCLNWGKVTCDNSKEHQAVKYTDLGPFSPGWMLKCKSNENRGMPSTLVACIRVSHFKTQESIEPLWHSAPYQVDLQQHNGKEKYISNGTNCSFPGITINNVQGNVTIAQHLITRKTGNVLQITENNQSTEQPMLQDY